MSAYLKWWTHTNTCWNPLSSVVLWLTNNGTIINAGFLPHWHIPYNKSAAVTAGRTFLHTEPLLPLLLPHYCWPVIVARWRGGIEGVRRSEAVLHTRNSDLKSTRPGRNQKKKGVSRKGPAEEELLKLHFVFVLLLWYKWCKRCLNPPPSPTPPYPPQATGGLISCVWMPVRKRERERDYLGKPPPRSIHAL